MICESCRFLNNSKQLYPSGSMTPDFYILGDFAVQAETDSEQVFSINSQAGQYLINTMYSLGMNNDNSRMFKLIRCTPKVYSEENEDVRGLCSQYALMDIWKTNPKIVIALGSEVAKFLLGDKFSSISSSRGRLYDVDINGKTIKVMPTYSPNFVVNNPAQAANFTHDLNHAKSYVQGELIDIAKKDLRYATTYEEFKDYYDSRLISSEMPAYDLETNAYDSRSYQAQMVGFSLAPNCDTGIYIVRKSLDYEMPSEDWDKIVELTKSYIKSRTVLVHNCMYEVPFTLNEWGIHIDNFEDTLIKARMLRGGDLGSAGLKDQCIKNLGYPDWDTDLSEYKDAFASLLKKLKPTTSGKNRWDYTHIRERGFCSLLETYEGYFNESRLDKREMANYESASKIHEIMSKYYDTETEYSIIMELIGDELCNLVDINYDGPFSYGFIPMKVISKYGAMDSVGTQDLNVFLNNQIEELSKELKIDLNRGYYYLKRQFIAGTRMELNGMYWNDKVASKVEDWCKQKCYDSLLSLLNSEFLANHLLAKKRTMISEYMFEHNLDYARSVFGDFNITKTGIKLPNGYVIKSKELVDEISKKIGVDFVESNRDWCLEIIRAEARKCTEFTELKSFFNPSSTTQYTKDLINAVFITPEIQIAHFMSKLNVMIDEENFDIYKYPRSDRALFQVLLDCRNYNKEVEEFNAALDDDSKDKELLESMDDLSSPEDDVEEYEEGEESDSPNRVRKVKLTSKETFDKFVETMKNTQITSRELQISAGESLNYRLESLAEGNIVELHKYYLIIGIELDNYETWTDRFKFLVDFRMYKKCYKMRSTYITGSRVGRGSVWMVDSDDLGSGELLTRRKRKYDGTFREGESCLMQATFNVCGAETLRWKAGMHTIPAESAIKNIYTSRFKGGVIAAPDFSQMEIRCMAGASKCGPMIEAFKNGADIHLENAVKIFKKPASEITSSERRYAKMASFQILYGGTPHSFGMEYLGGDVQLAQQIYDSFYAAYPEIKQFIDEKHEEMRTKGRVTTPMQFYINVSPERFRGDESKALRAAQNYPIQAAGSAMAGNVLYEVINFIDDNNLKSKCELFVHDSIEIDIHPDELLRMAVTILPLMNKYPIEEFGIPTTADLVIGPSIGQEIACTDIETNEDFTEGTMTCKGFEEDFLEMVDIWKEVYPVVEYEYLEEPTPYYESWSQFFISKRAVNPHYGTYRNKIKAKVHLVTKENANANPVTA